MDANCSRTLNRRHSFAVDIYNSDIQLEIVSFFIPFPSMAMTSPSG
jgi:hypothetical protein